MLTCQYLEEEINRLRQPQTSPALHNRDIDAGQQGCMKTDAKFDFILWARLHLWLILVQIIALEFCEVFDLVTCSIYTILIQLSRLTDRSHTLAATLKQQLRLTVHLYSVSFFSSHQTQYSKAGREGNMNLLSSSSVDDTGTVKIMKGRDQLAKLDLAKKAQDRGLGTML